jgi:hypothetical protein
MLAINDPEIAALSGYPIVSGHFSLPTLLWITEPLSVATVLREARTRLLSHYAFWRQSSEVRTTWRGFPALDHAPADTTVYLHALANAGGGGEQAEKIAAGAFATSSSGWAT